MTNLIIILIFLSLVLSFFGFLFSAFYFHDKLPDQKILLISLLFILLGMVIFGVANHFKNEIPKVVSEGCGTVKQYKQYSIKGKCYERLEIVLYGSNYLYYFSFASQLPRLQEQQHVCFKFYDRFKTKASENLLC